MEYVQRNLAIAFAVVTAILICFAVAKFGPIISELASRA